MRQFAIYLVVFLILGLIVFAINHPHMPVTLDDASTCMAYNINTMRSIQLGDFLTGHKTVLGGRLHKDEWIIGQPVICSPSIKNDVILMLRNPVIYGRLGVNRSMFIPNFAYRLISRSGSVIILLDPKHYWFSIVKFDSSGRIISDDDLFEEKGHWLWVLKRTFPKDPNIEKLWESKEYR